MNQMNIKSILFAVAVGFVVYQQAGAQYKISNSVFGNGGGEALTGSYHIVGTVGQPVIGVVSTSSHVNEVGFWYQSAGLITSVEQLSGSLPTEYQLEQNYPNPFNPTTTIRFALPKRSSVTLKLFDMLGREVATLVDEELQHGQYKVVFDARGLSTGVYFYRLQVGAFVEIKKLVLLK